MRHKYNWTFYHKYLCFALAKYWCIYVVVNVVSCCLVLDMSVRKLLSCVRLVIEKAVVILLHATCYYDIDVYISSIHTDIYMTYTYIDVYAWQLHT